jgi:kynurenine formamidase
MARQIFDLSVPLEQASFAQSVSIHRLNHREGARELGGRIGVNPDDFPDGVLQALETVTASVHAGTHLDAPWHYGPTCGGLPAKTISDVPLEWCYGDGVVIDVSHRKAGEAITGEDLKAGLNRINYTVKPWDIVLIKTGADKYMNQLDYMDRHPGMSREATMWLIDQGVKVIGTDGFGFDKPFKVMAKEHKEGVPNALWPSHMLGREKEYLHLEKLANLDRLPRPYGFKVAVFPINIDGAGAGWCRAVAILEE